MRDFAYHRPRDAQEAVSMLAKNANARYLAGGTTLYDLMKLGVESPAAVIDVTAIRELNEIDTANRNEVRIGANVFMRDLAENTALQQEYPALTESLWKAASQQLRNMATVGGNLLQRTRCSYFRGGPEFACNKREANSGCAAFGGQNRGHALLGGSSACIAVYPGDWAVALTAFDATVDVVGPQGARSIPIQQLHREPGQTPQVETSLAAEELIVRIRVPRSRATANSTYHKIRDRESYAFALVSAAVGLHIEAGRVIDARIALGGVATKPWRAIAGERSLVGQSFTRTHARQAAELCFADAKPLEHNKFKIALGVETVTDALMIVKERA
jgi:xanthine dehydrogenase YagS FAD-binding subunit